MDDKIDLSNDYLNESLPILLRAFKSQKKLLSLAAEKMADVIQHDNYIYVFGAGHAGIIAEELFYRAGGLVPVVPIFVSGLTLNTRPITFETKLEKLSGYADLIIQSCKITADDLLIIHSNSGINPVVVELAELAREKGIFVIGLTSISHSQKASSRHRSGLKLMDVADLVVDNCGILGDAVCEIEGQNLRVGSTSTFVGVALMNSLIVETAKILSNRGINPPIFRSANIDEKSEVINKKLMDYYRERLLYL